MIDNHAIKKRIGEQAVEKYIKNNMSIGLGSGTTAIWAVKHIAHLYNTGELEHIVCVATGAGTRLEAIQHKLPVYDLNHPRCLELDVAIDGADEIDPDSNLVKGGGACLLLEKIVAYSAKTFVVIAHQNKRVQHIGMKCPIPIEIIPSAFTRVMTKLRDLYKVHAIDIRLDAKSIGPCITEEGNYIIDMLLQREYNPTHMERDIQQVIGVVEVGIFSRKKPELMLIDDNGIVV